MTYLLKYTYYIQRFETIMSAYPRSIRLIIRLTNVLYYYYIENMPSLTEAIL